MKKQKMTKKEINKKYGLRSENFLFYLKVGLIKKVGLDLYELQKDLSNYKLEKGTVYRFCFNDTWTEDLKFYQEFLKYTSEVRIYSKEEIEKLKKKLDK